MKFIIFGYLYLLICSFATAELKNLGGAYGVGQHGYFEPEGPEVQIISTLSKGGWTYNVSRTKTDNTAILFTRHPDNDHELVEDIVTFNGYRWLFSQRDPVVRLVDQSETEIAILVGGNIGYSYFLVTKSANFTVPAGFHWFSTVDINSTNWKLSKLLVTPTDLDYSISPWDHSRSIKSIKLNNFNTIEVTKASDESNEIFSIHETHISKGEDLIQGTRFTKPSIATEAQIIGVFSVQETPTDEDVKDYVESIEGTKAHILGVLNEFQDQNAANQIRARIEQAYLQ